VPAKIAIQANLRVNDRRNFNNSAVQQIAYA